MKKEQIGDAMLIHADSMEWLRSLPDCFRVDAVITDPPYGVQFAGKVAKQRDGSVTKGTEGYAGFDDSPEYIQELVVPALEMALARAARGAVTPGTRNMWLYPRPADVGTFYSAAGTGLTSWGFCCSQPILFYGKCPYLARSMGARANSMGQSYPNDANESGHPCAKPLPQMKWLVHRVSMAGETVLDPFMGSGTTGVAAVQLGRKFLGIELHKPFFDIACQRLDDAQRQERMFA
jgi:site-specific DNA-methyltransferase (adenine-specific)